jgi:hypothetical protein
MVQFAVELLVQIFSLDVFGVLIYFVKRESVAAAMMINRKCMGKVKFKKYLFRKKRDDALKWWES